MKPRILSATAMILLTPLVVSAFQAQTEQVRNRELKNKYFTAGSLRITITRFYEFSVTHQCFIDIEVENTSDDIATFVPQQLTFIDKDDNQVNIVGQYSATGSSLVAAGDRRVFPKARIKRHKYELTDRVHLPARLYYEDKLLATIID
ncbi:MAG: hypothetical protein J2P21_03105 [Chloracidobacterium sp.]|nr:hypothetical protein [Chloracidobacterium sp.]